MINSLSFGNTFLRRTFVLGEISEGEIFFGHYFHSDYPFVSSDGDRSACDGKTADRGT